LYDDDSFAILYNLPPVLAMLSKRFAFFLISVIFVPGPVSLAQELPRRVPPGRMRGGPPRDGSGTPAAGEIKKYDDVISKDAQTYPGVFAVHRIEDKIYFEIPKEFFGRLMLWEAEVAKGPPGVSWGGMSLGSNVVRWDRRNHRVYLWKVAFAKRADGKAVQTAVDSANLDTIVASFPVEAEGKDRSTVIQATSLFTSDNADLSVRRAVGMAGAMGGGGVDESRSYLTEVKAFPTNIEVRSLLTFRGGMGGGLGTGTGRPTGGAQAGGPPGRSLTALVHYSLVMLPEKPMQARHFDPRVGYFVESFERYDDPKTWMMRRQLITRFRLEKKDPDAALSEPVRPIVFYLSREVPEKWRSYLKQGVEDWKPAFEEAGFKNAIVCRDAPERREDPTWDPEDARYSVIRWVAEPVANAMGPHVHDPRSGEIISAHIIFWHDIAKLTQLWYFVQCSAVDARARHLPLPDELTGELMRYVACHEVGHTLGLRHNHRASQAYTISQLRDPKFTAKYGNVASIMSYGRYNYVAQPEDGVKQLIPLLAPYDTFAICWGYKPILEAKSAEAERATLDEWAARQIKEPWLRFGGEDGPSLVDPSVLTENIGSDRLEATALGLKNLDRVLEHLVPATTTKGEDFTLLEEAYKAILTHERNWYGAVAKEVGGVLENRTLAGRGSEAYVRVPKDRQKQAVRFLLDHAFTTPTRLLNPAVVNQFRYTGVASDVQSMQRSLLQGLLSGERMSRLFDSEVLAPDKAYTAVELVNDVQDGLWSELTAAPVKIEPLRRHLQIAYVESLKKEFDAKEASATTRPVRPFNLEPETHTSELRAVARMALRDLSKRISAALPQARDVATQAHLEDALSEIESALTTQKK
jgi:hypothetical protein